MRHTAQIWDGDQLVTEVRGLDEATADRIASEAPLRGYTGRTMPESGKDWPAWRCYFPDGRLVTGRFGDGITRHVIAVAPLADDGMTRPWPPRVTA